MRHKRHKLLYIRDNYTELQKDYGGKFVVIHNENVVGSADTREDASPICTEDDRVIFYIEKGTPVCNS